MPALACIHFLEKATLSKFYAHSENGSTLNEKNLLPSREDIFLEGDWVHETNMKSQKKRRPCKTNGEKLPNDLRKSGKGNNCIPKCLIFREATKQE